MKNQPEGQNRRPLDLTGFSILLILCLIWGFQQVAMKAMAGAADPLLQSALRCTGAAALVWLYSRCWRRDPWLPNMAWREGLIVGLLFGGQYLMIGIGLRHINSGLFSVLLYTAPMFVAIILHVLLREERLSKRQWMGCALSMFGVALIFLNPMFDAPSETAGGLGGSERFWLWIWLFCALGSGLAWAATTVTVRLSRLSQAPVGQTLFYQLLWGALSAWPVVIAAGHTGWQSGPVLWMVTFYQTVIVCFISYFIWFWLLQRYLASRMGVVTLVSPVVAVALGAVLLRETLTPMFLLATLVIIFGLFIVMSADQRRLAQQRKPSP